ncbi:hypothetical protein BD413DRAFT_547614 [Trametes elegans]|nr:hypothetical protein BD413DRAFT_547614 [Trametes elegans]
MSNSPHRLASSIHRIRSVTVGRHHVRVRGKRLRCTFGTTGDMSDAYSTPSAREAPSLLPSKAVLQVTCPSRALPPHAVVQQLRCRPARVSTTIGPCEGRKDRSSGSEKGACATQRLPGSAYLDSNRPKPAGLETNPGRRTRHDGQGCLTTPPPACICAEYAKFSREV